VTDTGAPAPGDGGGYVGRFAPSPTGPLHAGSLLAALGSWLDARAHGGRWLLRIEDVDTPRCIAGADGEILRQLAALGLIPDAPPVWQSARTSAYAAALQRLAEAGLAYPCACSRRAIDDALAAAGHRPLRHGERVYPGTCRPERGGLAGRAPRAWRLHLGRCTPAGAALVDWHDRRLGAQRQDVAQEVGDFVLRRADGLWAYQLAVVVDDAGQGVSDVVRGEDLADNTPRQILLQRALGLPTPRYLHLPLLRDARGDKLGKQTGAPAVAVDTPAAALAALRAAAAALGLADPAPGATAVADWLGAAVALWPAGARRHAGRRPAVLRCAPHTPTSTKGSSPMDPREQRALLGIALLAAFADGSKADAEREEVRRLADSLGAQAAGLHVGALVQDVLLKRLTLAQAAAELGAPEHRQLAYEVAVCVVDADGAKSPAEAAFLAALQRELGLGAEAQAVEAQADALADAIEHPEAGYASANPAPAAAPASPAAPGAVGGGGGFGTAAALGAGAAVAAAVNALGLSGAGAAGAAGAAPARPPSAVAAAPATVMLTEAESAALDKSILNHAILCGALELLPQNWATMAIIPLQMKLVYGIGQRHGVSLDAGHVKEFLATAGVGLTSQYLEQFGRRLVGGLLGRVAGGIGRGVGRAGTGVVMSFATTYALGQLAKRYYGGGRQMNTAVLKDSFSGLLGPAQKLQQQYLPQIEQRARTLDAGQIMNLVRQPLA